MVQEINFFAETTFRNQGKKFGIKLDDRRRHVYVVGKTGMGKSVLLENMAIQDIQNGRGIGFIDPHGESAERIIDFVPSNRINDVVYINPADINYPIAFNIMEKVDVGHRHLVASGLMGVFKKIWPDVWSARMEYILNNCILALLEYPGATLLGINKMLVDVEYRKKVLDKVTDPVVKAFWVKEFSRYTQRYEVEATAAIQNKIGQFISAPLIRNIVGQVRSAINMREIMDEGKILIINLSKGRIGEDNSRLLGALLITKLQLAAMQRVNIAESERKDFFLYVDEFQNFATEAFCNILSEARKYRLALTLGNQYIAQLEEMTSSGKSTRVKDAVFGNVGTIITFRIGAEDAEFLEKEFFPDFVAADFVNLAKYNIYLRLMIDGLAGRPFSAKTLSPWPKVHEPNTEKIIKISRERYGTPRQKVEEKIARWSGVLDLPNDLQAIKPPTTALYDTKCSVCGKDTKVVFVPDGVRPVYCKSCRKKTEKERFQAPPQNKESEKAKEPKNENTVPLELAKSEELEPPKASEPKEGPPRISLDEVTRKEPVPFSHPRRSRDFRDRNRRKEVNIGELKKVLKESLNEQERKEERPRDNNRNGIIRPGETVKF